MNTTTHIHITVYNGIVRLSVCLMLPLAISHEKSLTNFSHIHYHYPKSYSEGCECL